MRPGGDADYVSRLGAALEERDPEVLRSFLLEQARRYGDDQQVSQVAGQSDQEIETLMHRMTLARADLAPFHAESRQWLAQRGVSAPSPERHRRK